MSDVMSVRLHLSGVRVRGVLVDWSCPAFLDTSRLVIHRVVGGSFRSLRVSGIRWRSAVGGGCRSLRCSRRRRSGPGCGWRSWSGSGVRSRRWRRTTRRPRCHTRCLSVPSIPRCQPGRSGPRTPPRWVAQYLSIRYSNRLAEAGISPSVGSVADSYDNALAESVIGLYKTELIRQRGPWKDRDQVEYATLEYVDWFNHRRLLEPIGNIPPAEKEANYHRQQKRVQLAGLK